MNSDSVVKELGFRFWNLLGLYVVTGRKFGGLYVVTFILSVENTGEEDCDDVEDNEGDDDGDEDDEGDKAPPISPLPNNPKLMSPGWSSHLILNANNDCKVTNNWALLLSYSLAACNLHTIVLYSRLHVLHNP